MRVMRSPRSYAKSNGPPRRRDIRKRGVVLLRSGIGNRLTTPLLAGFLQNGGLDKVLSGLRAEGKGAQAESWISTGENDAVSGADLESAMGKEEISRIAAKLGLSEEETADALAEVLPRVVDTVSPQGELPAENELDDLFAQVARAET